MEGLAARCCIHPGAALRLLKAPPWWVYECPLCLPPTAGQAWGARASAAGAGHCVPERRVSGGGLEVVGCL